MPAAMDSKTPLYHTCQDKARYCWSDKSFTDLLVLLLELLPEGNKLPCDIYEAKLVIYLQDCPICGTSRYKRRKDKGDGEGGSMRRGAPRKVVWYLPIIPRLKRLFANEKEAKLLRWHKEGRKNDGMLRHPADGSQWRNIDKEFEGFSADARNLRLL
ncbi:hypothetical protein ACP70R_015740 [Stipagrostis hirtigluma subsp. patula]